MVIRETLRVTHGDKRLTAQLLGIATRTIYRKLAEERDALVAALVPAGCRRDPRRAAPRPPVRVAAAADLASRSKSSAEASSAQTGRRVVFSFGSTGLLARQLREGAPFDVFAAANVSFVDEVVAAGVVRRRHARPLRARPHRLVDPARRRRPPRDARGPRAPAVSPPRHRQPRARALRSGRACRRSSASASGTPSSVASCSARTCGRRCSYAQTGNVDAAIVALALVVNDRENPWRLMTRSIDPSSRRSRCACAAQPRGGRGLRTLRQRRRGQGDHAPLRLSPARREMVPTRELAAAGASRSRSRGGHGARGRASGSRSRGCCRARASRGRDLARRADHGADGAAADGAGVLPPRRRSVDERAGARVRGRGGRVAGVHTHRGGARGLRRGAALRGEVRARGDGRRRSAAARPPRRRWARPVAGVRHRGAAAEPQRVLAGLTLGFARALG
jgi:molybdate transport system substrate-binding protein